MIGEVVGRMKDSCKGWWMVCGLIRARERHWEGILDGWLRIGGMVGGIVVGCFVGFSVGY